MPAAVIVESLSKQYRLGELNRKVMLREALANAVRRLRTPCRTHP